MSDRDRVLAYLTGLVAVFVLALLVGRLAAPYLAEEPEPRHGVTHERASGARP